MIKVITPDFELSTLSDGFDQSRFSMGKDASPGQWETVKAPLPILAKLSYAKESGASGYRKQAEPDLKLNSDSIHQSY